MDKIKKKPYTPPLISVLIIEMEQGIAAASATINPIGPNSNENVEVNDWQDTNSGQFDVDL